MTQQSPIDELQFGRSSRLTNHELQSQPGGLPTSLTNCEANVL